MYLPEITDLETSRDMIEEFKGYNHNIRCADGEFYDMNNLSAYDYPVLSTRPLRGLVAELDNPHGIVSKKGLTYVDDKYLYVNGEKITLKIDNKEYLFTDTEKQLICMGAYLIVLPDKIWVNTEKDYECGYIEQINSVSCASENVTFGMCSIDGDEYNFTDKSSENYVNPSSTEPNDPKDGQKWYDSTTGYLKKWAEYTQQWVTVSTVYIKISGKGIGKGISKGDAVDFEGIQYMPKVYSPTDSSTSPSFFGQAYIKSEDKDKEYVSLYKDPNCTASAEITEAKYPSYFWNDTMTSTKRSEWVVNGDLYIYIEGRKKFHKINWENSQYQNTTMSQLSKLNTNMLVQNVDTDYIIVVGILNTIYTQKLGTIKISRTMPIMDYVIECNNRLWGCRYGKNKKGEIVNEIYASKQGDFKNWNCYAGISTDSYAVTVGSDGEFTGAINYGSYPMFFKENYIHRISGAIPSQFAMNTTNCRGVQKGSEKSLAISNEILFYKSSSDVCMYEGSLPSSISTPLGNVNYRNARAGTVGTKYYISMQRCDTDEWEMFVYDLSSQLWHKEDNTKAEYFARVDTDLYYVEGNKLISPTGQGELEDNIEWFFQTGVMGYSYPDNKYLGRMDIRVNMKINAYIKVLVEYNSSGDFETIGYIKARNTQSINLPIKPKRCDHFSLRFEGNGECKIFSIAKYLEIGSDKFV